MLLRSRLSETQVLELCLSMFRAWLLVPLTLCDDKIKGCWLVLGIAHTSPCTCDASVSMMRKERSRTETKVSELVVSGSRSPSTCALYVQIIPTQMFSIRAIFASAVSLSSEHEWMTVDARLQLIDRPITWRRALHVNLCLSLLHDEVVQSFFPGIFFSDALPPMIGSFCLLTFDL